MSADIPFLHMLAGPESWLISALYLACAGSVTVDVLLKKSDVRSAMGWVAIAWLSPIFGALLYYFFGINRVARRALKLEKVDSPKGDGEHFTGHPDAAANIAALAEIGRRVTHTHLTAGNRLAILQGGNTAYPAMLEAIRGARKCIAMTSYIFRDDEVGREFIAALGEAQERGVAVRVLVDSVGSSYLRPAAWAHLRAIGVPAARFLHTWIPWRMPFLNMRNHRKILVVDGITGFVGGMNISVENTLDDDADGAVKDVHFRIEGPVVRHVMHCFARDWMFTTDEALDGDIWWPDPAAPGHVFARGLRSGPDADIYKLEAILGAALTQAQHRIRIVTPYFLPDQRLQFAIAQAVLRGVKVDILIPQQSDNRLMQWATRAHLRFFRHIHANFYFIPPPFEHTKLVTMDGEWCLIGSSNWDTRSFRLNFEFDVECYDRELPAALDQLIDEKIARAQKVTPAVLAAPIWQLLRDAAARLLLPYL